MRVICPTVHVHGEVSDALHVAWPTWQRRLILGDDGYWKLLAALWDDKAAFATVEHDIVVRPDTLRELHQCSSPWCAFEYHYVGISYAGLGCMKFSTELIARNPDALDAIAAYSDPRHPPKHWCRLDAWLQGYLQDRGEELCVHRPALEHLRSYPGQQKPSHGCWL